MQIRVCVTCPVRLEDEDLPERCCWSLRVGFSVACQVPQMFACSSEMPSGWKKKQSGEKIALYPPWSDM